MSKKNAWLTNPVAVSHAQACAEIIEKRLGMRLALSNPVFIGMVKEVNRLIDIPGLDSAYTKFDEQIQQIAAREANEETLSLKQSV